MKTYLLDNIGEIGEANLLLGVEKTQGVHWSDLQIGESTFVQIRGNSNKVRLNGRRRSEAKLEKLTRVK